MASANFKSVSNEDLRSMYVVAAKCQKMAMDANMTELVSVALEKLAEIGKEIQYRGINYPKVEF